MMSDLGRRWVLGVELLCGESQEEKGRVWGRSPRCLQVWQRPSSGQPAAAQERGPAVRGSWLLGLCPSRGRAHDKVQALP